jgi:hypothetical protein
MGAIIIDEMEFKDVMKKLKVEVVGGIDDFRLYNASDINSKGDKIHVVQLNVKQMTCYAVWHPSFFHPAIQAIIGQ